MTNCRETTRLLSDASERWLAAKERRDVERHFASCPACRRCAEQSSLLHRTMERLRQEKAG